MTKEPTRILAVNPGSRYIGWAAFRGPELLDWGVRVIRAKTPRGKLASVQQILFEAVDRFHPDTLAVKRLHSSRTSGSLSSLTNKIKQRARRRRLRVCEYSIEQLKQHLSPNGKLNKRGLAEHVAAEYPALAPDFRKEQANRNPYYVRMFEAVALGMVCYERLENESQIH